MLIIRHDYLIRIQRQYDNFIGVGYVSINVSHVTLPEVTELNFFRPGRVTLV